MAANSSLRRPFLPLRPRQPLSPSWTVPDWSLSRAVFHKRLSDRFEQSYSAVKSAARPGGRRNLVASLNMRTKTARRSVGVKFRRRSECCGRRCIILIMATTQFPHFGCSYLPVLLSQTSSFKISVIRAKDSANQRVLTEPNPDKHRAWSLPI